MKTGAMSKLSASIMVLVLALSALVVLPGSSEGATQGVNTIYVPVSDGSPVSGAAVTLTNVHTGDVIQAPMQSPGLYVAQNAPSAYYRVDVVSENHYDEWGAKEFRFEGFSSYTVTPTIMLEKFDTKAYLWNVTVRDADGKLPDARVGFYNPVMNEMVAQATTNSQGLAAVDMFRFTDAGDFALVVQKTGYEMHYDDTVTVTSDDNVTVILTDSFRITGFVQGYEGPASNVVAYLLSSDTSLPWIQRLMKSTGGSFFEFDVVPGDYLLCVDADGVASYMSNIPITTGSVDLTLDDLDNQTQRLQAVNITYGANFNSFTLDMDTVWSYDDAFPGLKYADIGSLRLQIDLNFGSTDGEVSGGEISQFLSKLDTCGTQYVTSYGLLDVNDTIYRSATDVSGPTLGGLNDGDLVTDTGGIAYSYGCSYTSYPLDSIDVGAEMYTSNATVEYDTDSVDYLYTVRLPAGYELASNTTGNAGSHVDSFGYLEFVLDPEEYVGGPEVVRMEFEAFEGPVAGAGIEPSDSAYAVKNETGAVLRYMVKVGEDVNFTAFDSSDPNGNPLEFTWDFGDGSAPVTTSEIVTAYAYSNASLNRTVTMTVTDVSSEENSTEFMVVCDALDPTPVLTVKDLTVNETTNTLEVDQGQVVWFNAINSTDDVEDEGDEAGIVKWAEFTYGEGNSSGIVDMTEDEKNVSHAWSEAGTYNLTLNVTDAVGHWKNTTITVLVNDTEAPVPTFVVKNETWGDSLEEKLVIVFDANGTVDNLDNITALHFSWYFNDDLGEESWMNGTGLYNVTHVFEKAGSFAVRVNVTDTSDNWNGHTKTVTIASGPRPYVIIDSVTFEPETFAEDKTGYIVVNLTNRGSAVATGVVLTFYIENLDGTEDVLGEWTQLLNGTATVTSIEVGGTASVRFPYAFKSPGVYTIRVNVTSNDQLNVDEDVGEIEVEEAGWKKAALWGGVAAVIILVPVLLYLRGRWSKRERRGPRREKPKKEKEKNKDKGEGKL
ncbi:PKD domain-containing protein [Candidatus Bathyarchaeota archaeon]|nr:PKD domain-containing protein [Candidatus Bathyarchaeota archaeon]